MASVGLCLCMCLCMLFMTVCNAVVVLELSEGVLCW